MIRRLIPACVGLAAACLAAAHAWAGAWPWSAASLGLGAAWLIGRGRGWSLAAPLGFAASVALAALGLWLSGEGGAGSLCLLAVIAALCAWDLDGLARRLPQAADPGDQARLERQHLRRLLGVAAVGLLLGGVALAVQIRLAFLPALLLSLLAVLGLSWAVALLRSASG